MPILYNKKYKKIEQIHMITQQKSVFVFIIRLSSALR